MKIVHIFTIVACVQSQSFLFQLCDFYGEYSPDSCKGLQAIQGPKAYPTPPTDPKTLGLSSSNATQGYLPPLSTLMHNSTSPECTRCTTCGPGTSLCKYGCELTKSGASNHLVGAYWGMTEWEAPCIESSMIGCKTCGNAHNCTQCFDQAWESYKKCYIANTHLPDNISDSTVECYSRCSLNSTLHNFFDCSKGCYRNVYSYLQLWTAPGNHTSQDSADNSQTNTTHPYNLTEFFNNSFCFDPNHANHNASAHEHNTTASSTNSSTSDAAKSYYLITYGLSLTLITIINLLAI